MPARSDRVAAGPSSSTGPSAWLFGCLFACLVACSAPTWHPVRVSAPAPSSLHGAWDCSPDDPDCNSCATDVRAQFRDGSWQKGDNQWAFEPRRNFHGITPDEAYHGSILEHVQGFVRLNGPGVRFAMVHSGGLEHSGARFASLSIIDERAQGGLGLSELRSIDAAAAHTSGLFTLGRYVGMFSADGVLSLLDTSGDRSGPQLDFTLPIPGPRAHGISSRSGGVAMIRLAEGGYLLLANEGGDGPSSGHSHFYWVQNDLRTLTSSSAQLNVRDLGDWQYPYAHDGPSDYHHSENLSLLTECQTGDIYAVYVGSSQSLIQALGPLGRTFWRVARVVVSGQGVELEPIGVYTRLSSPERCFGRAAGSAFVQADHRIELLCHQWEHFRGYSPAWQFWEHLASVPASSIPPPESGAPKIAQAGH